MDYNQKKAKAIETINEFKIRMNNNLEIRTEEEIIKIKKLGKQFGLTNLIKDI